MVRFHAHHNAQGHHTMLIRNLAILLGILMLVSSPVSVHAQTHKQTGIKHVPRINVKNEYQRKIQDYSDDARTESGKIFNKDPLKSSRHTAAKNRQQVARQNMQKPVSNTQNGLNE